MDKISSLFTTLGDMLNASSWFQLVQWSFWTLLFILALCGVYTARFEKGNLLCQGFQGALKLAIIYMVATFGYVRLPGFMDNFSQLPFLSVSEEALTLVNPLGLLDRWYTALPGVLVRLYFLLLFINFFAVFDYNPVNFVTWFISHVVTGLAAVVIHAFLSFLIVKFWPGSMIVLHDIAAILLLLVFGLLFIFKLHYTFINKGGNHTYQVVFQALTKKKYGAPFTVSAISFLIVVIYLVIANLFGHARMEFGSFSYIAFALNFLMCTMTLYCFSRYFNNK